MGLTSFSYSLLERYVTAGCSILEMGNQTVYFGKHILKPAKLLLQARGYKHTSIDANGRNGALPLDLRKKLNLGLFDIVTDFGTCEHIKDMHACWLNKYNSCKEGGYIISENPEVGSWPGHGFHYFTEEFYRQLETVSGLVIAELGRHAACGNEMNGWNIFCVMQKITHDRFVSKIKFNTIQLKFNPNYEKECEDENYVK